MTMTFMTSHFFSERRTVANSSTKLTADQQTQLASWARNFRAYISEKSKLNTTERNLDAAYLAANVGISSILALLSAGDTIDDQNGLSGAGPLTVAAIQSSIADLEFDLGKYNNGTYIQAWSIICGPTNL